MQPIEKLEDCGESNCLTFIHFGEEGEENFMELEIGLGQEIDLTPPINTPLTKFTHVFGHIQAPHLRI